MKRLPSIVYETYPYLGILAGFFCLLFASTVVAVVCGVLLIAASMLIMKMRVHWRRQSAHRAGRP